MIKQFTTDRIIGISAIFISLLTLIIFIYQTNLMREQTRLSVQPYLSVDSIFNRDEGYFSIELINNGLGPAIIETRNINLKGKTYDLNLYDLLEENTSLLDSINTIKSESIDKGTAIPINTGKVLLRIYAETDLLEKFVGTLISLQDNNMFGYEIVYKSIYKEKWKITELSEAPIEF